MRKVILKKKNSKIEFIIILFLMPYFYPTYFETNSVLLIIKQICTYLGIVYVGCTILKNKNNFIVSDYISLPIIIIMGYHIWQLISSNYNGIDLSYDIHNVMWEAMFLIILQYLIFTYGNLAIESIANWFSILVFFNMITVVLWTNHNISPEMNNYLLGYRYSFCIIILADILFNAYVSIEKNGTIFSYRVIFNVACGIVTIAIIGPSTLLAGLMIFAFVYIASKSEKLKYNIFVPLGCLVLPIFFQIIIIEGNTNPIFRYIIENILGRSMTFTGRTLIWKSVFEKLANCNIIYGYGNPLAIGQDGWAIAWWDSTRYVTAHNQFLQTLTTAGVIGLIFEFLIIAILVIQSWKYSKKLHRAIFIAAMFSMLIMMTSTIMVPVSYKEAIFVLISYSIRNMQFEKCLKVKKNLYHLK